MKTRNMKLNTISTTSLCAVALMTPSAFAQQVGVASAVDQSVMGKQQNEAQRVVRLGHKVIHNERINTDGAGLLQILLADGTSFTVGPNSSLVIDSFIYDPDAGTAKVTATLGKGLFRFIGGVTSKTPGGAMLNTPVGTVGIRGGIVDLDLSPKGNGQSRIDLRYGESVKLYDSRKLVAKAYHNGYSIVIDEKGRAKVEKTDETSTTSFARALSGKSGTTGGKPGKTEIAQDEVETTSPTKPYLTTPISVAGRTPPAQVDGVAATTPSTWGDIYNSSLAGATASYSGAMEGTASNDGINFYDATGTFTLTYSFGVSNGGGTFVSTFDGQSFTTSVGPDSLSGTSDATFSGSGFSGSLYGTVDGTFEGTATDPATGVSGIFDYEASSGSWEGSGTFSGDIN